MTEPKTFKFPLDIQFFASDGEETEEIRNEGAKTEGTEEKQDEGTKTDEGTILGNYFQQQGVSADEATQAISAFKKQKEGKTPDVATLNAQLAEATKKAQDATVLNIAYGLAGDLEVDAKTIGYIVQLADKTGVVDGKGNVNADKLKTALSKVLEDLPMLKKPKNPGSTGGLRVGAGSGNGDHGGQDEDDALLAAFGVKKKK